MDEPDRAKEFEELWPEATPAEMQTRLRAQHETSWSLTGCGVPAACVGFVSICGVLVFVVILALAMAAAVLGLLVLVQRLWSVLFGVG